MPPIQPRGPAYDGQLSSLDPSNPYKFPPELWKAGKLPPKVTDTHVFFFGYEGPEPEVCLQQWFPAPMTDSKGHTFPTTEHYMMYHKALLMGDEDIASQILSSPHPSAAKRLGRLVSNFDLERWKEHADRIVEEANYLKFSQNDDLKAALLETGQRELVEASPDDKIWGIGFNSDEAEGRESEWGNNGLGKALMRVRERLRGESGK